MNAGALSAPDEESPGTGRRLHGHRDAPDGEGAGTFEDLYERIERRGVRREGLPAANANAVGVPPRAQPPRPRDDEMRVLLVALDVCGGRGCGPAGAAALLGLEPTTLQGKPKKYGVEYGRRGIGAP